MPKISRYFLNRPDIGVKAHVIAPRDSLDSLVSRLVREGLFEPLPPKEAGREAERLKKRLALAQRALMLCASLSSRLRERVEVEVRALPWSIDEGLEKLVAELEPVEKLVEREEAGAAEARARAERLRALALLARALSAAIPGADSSLLDYDGELVSFKALYGPRERVEAALAKALGVLGRVEVGGKVAAAASFEPGALRSMQPSIADVLVEEARGLPRKPLGELAADLEREASRLEGEAEAAEGRAQEAIKGKAYEIAVLKVLAEAVESELGVLRSALESRYLAVVSGFTTKSRAERLRKIAEGEGGHVVFEEEPNPPVDFNNARPFKPFELFTEIMGYPSPSEWDPTPLLTYLYLVFFSLMFPDVGYAIGLIVGSRLVLPKFVESRETLKKLVDIATAAGLASIVAGVLSGSFFGSLLGSYISAALPPLLPSLPPRLSDVRGIEAAIMSYIAIALVVGYVVVMLSHSIGLAKALVSRSAQGALFESLLLAIMVMGPPAASASLPVNIDVFGLLRWIPPGAARLAGAALVIAYAAAKSALDRPFGALMWIFDVLGLMADVLSFVRIAGIAIGGAILAELINGVVLQASSLASGVAHFLGFAVGAAAALLLHLVNLGLSSISPFVHSLRLIMYEVSSKFYEGSGRKLSPASLPPMVVRLGPSR